MARFIRARWQSLLGVLLLVTAGILIVGLPSILAGPTIGTAPAGPLSPGAPNPDIPVPDPVPVFPVNSPGVFKLTAKYAAHSTMIVSGHASNFDDTGRIHFDSGNFSEFRECGEFHEMMLTYVNGTCLRYFPFSQYGHHVPVSSLDKDRIDFGKFWRPLLAYLSPQDYLSSLPSLAPGPNVVRDGLSYLTYISDPDQNAELASRHPSSVLEYWGPVPDLTVFVDSRTKRITRVEAQYYKRRPNADGEAVPDVIASMALGNFENIGGASVPTTITYQAQYPFHNSPYRTTVVDLMDVVVGGELPADAFTPIWPEDYIFLDVENQGQEFYKTRSDDPTAVIQLADYYFGTFQHDEGMNWLSRYESMVTEDGQMSSFELSNLARLLSVSGQASRSVNAHLEAIDAQAASGELGTGEEASFYKPSRLSQMQIEFGFHEACKKQKGSVAGAVEFLTAEADAAGAARDIALLVGRISSHLAMKMMYDDADAAIDLGFQRVVDDESATQWLKSCRQQVAESRSRNDHYQAIRAKLDRMRELRGLIASAEEDGIEVDPALVDELNTLQTTP